MEITWIADIAAKARAKVAAQMMRLSKMSPNNSYWETEEKILRLLEANAALAETNLALVQQPAEFLFRPRPNQATSFDAAH